MRNSTAFRRVRVLLTHFAVGVLGVIAGLGLAHWLRAYLSQPLTMMKCYAAMQSDKSGNEDKAIILLSQATIEDPGSYEPWVLLGQIYSRKGNRQLALELYSEALALFDQKTDYSLPVSARPVERDMIRKNIDALQIELKNQKTVH